MKIQNVFALFVFTCVLTSVGHSQLRKDIGIKYEVDSERNLVVDFRVPFANKWRVNFGASYASDSWINTPSMFPLIVDANDSTVITRSAFGDSNGADLRFGFNRQLKWPIFSISGELHTGFRLNDEVRINHELMNSSGNWDSPPTIQSGGNFAWVQTYYLNTGVLASANLDLPLGKRFLFNAYVAAQTVIQPSILQRELADPLNEFDSQSGFGQVLTYNFNMKAGIGLRYVFGKTKE